MLEKFNKKKTERERKIDAELEDMQRKVRCECRSISVKPQRPEPGDVSDGDDEIDVVASPCRN